jgi:uncharacterized damage-inducible protein DinB
MSVQRQDVVPVKGMDLQLGLLLAMLDDNTQQWRGELEMMPEEAVVWQPFPNGHSVGGALLHIASAELLWIVEVAAGRVRSEDDKVRLLSTLTRQRDVQWPTPPRRPISWYFEQQDEVRARTRPIIQELADPLHTGARGERVVTLRWILHHLITHEAYHSGQAILCWLQFASRER